MQLLMSQTAFPRVAERLAVEGAGLDIVTIGADGLRRPATGQAVDAVDPHIVWISLDIYREHLLSTVLTTMLRGRNARWAQTFMAGLDHPVFRDVISRGIRVTRSDAQTAPIAEYVIAHAFSLLHPIEQQRQAQDDRAWRRIAFREIASTRWLLVGFGAIGRGVAARLKPFGAHVTAMRRAAVPDPLADAVCTQDALERALAESDVVILCCALTDATRGLADASFFRAMKPGALFINVARGGLVDEKALRRGLDDDRPAHAVLDVFGTEPLPDDAWQWRHPRVRVTAHTSNAGDGVQARGDALFLDNLARFRADKPLRLEAAPEEVGLTGTGA